MEKVIATALPLAFLAHLLASEAALARRRIAIGGRPPIHTLPFLASKYLAIGIWAAASLQSWGLGWQPLALAPAPLWLSGGLWVCGFALLFLGHTCLGAHLRFGLPSEATRLHCNGVYRFSRNPMYAGIDATILAAILYTRNPAMLAAGAFVAAVHHRIILAEERWLLHTFGPDYERYRDRVARYLTLPLAVRRGLYGAKAFWRLLHMGHCAPTVMSTLRNEEWAVRLAAGLPGGIGNTGGECGGITSPLMLLGLRHGLREIDEGLPLVFDLGHDHMARFRRCRGTLLCREIRGTPPRVLPCVRTVAHSAGLIRGVLSGDDRAAITGETRAAYRRLYAELAGCGFHCAQDVLRQVDGLPAGPQLLDAASAFLGGTLFTGMTCSALTAGVMALGLRIGEIEGNPLRVLHMVALMWTGGPAFDDGVNKFNVPMNRGGELASWFATELGSTQCRAITHADFSSPAGVEAYLSGGGIAACRRIAARVAGRVRLMLDGARV